MLAFWELLSHLLVWREQRPFHLGGREEGGRRWGKQRRKEGMRKKKGTKIGVREEKRGGKERSRHMLPNTVLISARMNDHTLDINCSSPFCWSSSSGFLSNCVRSLPTNWTSYSSWGDPSGLGRWAYCSTLLGYDGVM